MKTSAWSWVLLGAAGLSGLTLSLFRHRATPIPLAYIEPTRTAHYPLTFVAQLKNDPHAGKKIFKEYCALCHAENPQIALGAPRIGNKKEWARYHRMEWKNLFDLATQGVGAMPARGGCFECSDAQLKKAIQYLMNS